MPGRSSAARTGDGPRILYVAHGDVGETIAAAVERSGGVPIEATDGTDAIKRHDYEAVDLVVVPASLPDVPLEAFLTRLDVDGHAGPPIAVGEIDRTAEPVIQLPSDVSVEALADRIDRAIQERRLGDELDRHERLKTALVRLLGPVLDAEDAGAVSRIVYDELQATNAYRAVWVGRFEPDDGAIEMVQPIRQRVDADEVGTLVGGVDGAFISRAIESGTVTTTREAGSIQEAEPAVADDPSDRGLAFTAVPFDDGERVHGVAILSSHAEDAPDASERSLLSRLGRVCGLALVDTAAADDADDRLEGMLRAVGHELRNPLQVATLSLEAAREDGDEEAFDRLADAIEAIEEVVDATVDIAVGRSVEELQETSLHEMAVTAWHEVREPPAELTIVEPTTVEADPAQLERLLSNLLRNAVDHAGPEVSVRVGTLGGGRGFYVEDDGPGIPPDERESVFEWGYSTGAGGLGVGLPLVREIADAHGWTVSVTEATGGGARFEVRTAAGRPGPQDELTKLFREESTGFEFRDATVE